MCCFVGCEIVVCCVFIGVVCLMWYVEFFVLLIDGVVVCMFGVVL